MDKRRLVGVLALSLAIALTLSGQAVAAGEDGRIAFSGWDSDAPGNQIFVVDPGGTNRIQLTHDTTRAFGGPRWSPDGRLIATIAYKHDRGLDRMVAFDLNGQIQSEFAVPYAKLTAWTSREVGGSLQPAESQLFLLAEGTGDGSEDSSLLVRDFQGNVKAVVAQFDSDLSAYPIAVLRSAAGVEWLGDGPNVNTARIWYLYQEYTVDMEQSEVLDGFVEHRIVTLDTSAWPDVSWLAETTAPTMPSSIMGGESPLVWSRARDKIAWSDPATWPGFTVAPVTFDAAGLPVADLAGSVEIAETDLYPRGPSFSPDGTEIAFCDYLSSHHHYFHVFVTDATQSSRSKVIDGQNPKYMQAFSPDWGPPAAQAPEYGITISPESGLVTTEGGGTDSFTAVLDAAPASDVTVVISSSDTSEGLASPASLIFTTSNWDTAQAVTVTGVEDTALDGDQQYSIVTAAAVSDDPNYDGMDAVDVAVTNLDNEIPDDTCHIGDLDGSASSEKNKWRAEITILVHDKNHAPLAAANVSGSWIAGDSGSASCTTGSDGLCTVAGSDANKNVAEITFAVEDIDHAYCVYSASDNHDPEGDSDGTTITVYKP